MTRSPRAPSPLMKLANRIPRLLAERRIGGVHRQILVLETRGRRTGKAHRVPLGWVEMDGGFYLIAPHGAASDWLRNARAVSDVTVTLHGRRRAMRAEDVTDPAGKEAVVRAYAARYPQARRQITNATGSDDLAAAARSAGVLRLLRRR
jgi:deazaflavin-dependent oxidoreductase (nitroreductase family)